MVYFNLEIIIHVARLSHDCCNLAVNLIQVCAAHRVLLELVLLNISLLEHTFVLIFASEGPVYSCQLHGFL